MPPIRQTSFVGGELSRRLWARSDLAKYGSSARRLRNFFVSQEGAAISRAGTKYVAEVKDSSKKVRLIPFVYSDSTSYVLEFGNLYVRFHRNGAPVLSGGVPYEVVTPYVEADLPKLKFAQSGDVLFLSHGNYAARELTRIAETNWTLAQIDFASVEFYFPGAWSFAGSMTNPALESPPPAGSASEPAREWVYQVTAIAQETATGKLIETLPFTITDKSTLAYPPVRNALADHFVAPYQDTPVNVWMLPTNGLVPGPLAGYNIVSYRVYRGRGNVFGYIGSITPSNTVNAGFAATKFVDVGGEPDYTQQPPLGRNPFQVKNEAGAVVRTEDPVAIAFHEQRLVLSGTTERPEWIWPSKTNDYNNFDTHLLPVASDSMEFELAARKREETRSLLGHELGLLVLTDTAIWRVSGPDGGPLAANNLIEARLQVEIGASWLDPLSVEDTVLFSRAKGTGVRDLFYDQGRRKFIGSDLSSLATHLFTGYTLSDWTYAEDPWSIVWAVRSDGKLLSLTYSREQEVLAWSWHDTDGVVENVVAVPETTEDFVYVVVRRTIGGATKRYVERMATRVLPLDVNGDEDITQALCLDCAKTYSGAPATVVTGLGHLEGRDVYALADGVVFGPLTVAAGQVTIPVEDGASFIHVGLLYTPELETLDIASNATELRTKQKTVTRVSVEVQATGAGIQAGETFDDLTDAILRDVSDDYSAVGAATGLVDVDISHTWNKGGRACLRQTAPLPVTVLGITREVDVGGN